MTDSGNGAELLTGHQPSSPPGLGSGGGGAPAGDKQATVPLRIVSSDADILALSPTEYLTRWRQQESFVTALERKLAQQEGELTDVKQAADKVRVQLAESQQRERVLMRRLTAKEQETQDYLCQLNELKNSQTPTASTLRSTLLDPAVNCVIQQLKCELQATRSKLEDTQNEMAAWKFTPDSNTGKRLMAKCRLLYQENEELGKITSSGRIAKLESDLALQKSFSEEVRKSQQELDSFLADLDEDVEGMQSTIFFLQQELRKAKEAKDMVQKENATLKLQQQQQQQQQHEQQQQQQQPNSRSNGDASVVCCEPDTNNVLLLNNNNSSSSSSNSNSMMRTDMETDENTAVLVNNQPQTTVVVDDENVENNMMSSSSTGGSCNRTRVKRVRTSSVLSIDYTEDDALVINTNGDVAMSSDHE